MTKYELPISDLNKQHICQLLFHQAVRCQTVNGSSLLLAIKAHLEGRLLIDECDELWQAADVIANNYQNNRIENKTY